MTGSMSNRTFTGPFFFTGSPLKHALDLWRTDTQNNRQGTAARLDGSKAKLLAMLEISHVLQGVVIISWILYSSVHHS